MMVRIVDTPPGEAPLAVRQAWVGLVLPLWPGEAGPRSVLTAGVLSGPRSLWGFLWGRLIRRFKPLDGFLVDAAAAVDILARHDPSAAAWWRERAPLAVASGRVLVFRADVCELVKGSPVLTTPDEADPGGPFTSDLG